MTHEATGHAETRVGSVCSCPDPDSDEVGYVAYATGLAEAEKFIEDERAHCPIHGPGSQD